MVWGAFVNTIHFIMFSFSDVESGLLFIPTPDVAMFNKVFKKSMKKSNDKVKSTLNSIYWSTEFIISTEMKWPQQIPLHCSVMQISPTHWDVSTDFEIYVSDNLRQTQITITSCQHIKFDEWY